MYAELQTFAVVLAMKCNAELKMHSVAASPGSGRYEVLMTAQSNIRVRPEAVVEKPRRSGALSSCIRVLNRRIGSWTLRCKLTD